MDSPWLPSGFSFSQSSLQDYSDCPRRFKLRYIDQLQWPAVEMEPLLENEHRQLAGQLFHRMVQQHLIGLPADKITRHANSPDLSRWWENYQKSKFDLSGYCLHTELTLAAPVGAYRLMAKYDLVAIRPGDQAFIYDWKTYQKRPRDEWMAARLQTRVYLAMIIQASGYLNSGRPLLPEQVEMIYWYAGFPSEPARFTYHAAQHQRNWDALTSLILEISNHKHFPLTEDDKRCTYCPYRSYCNRGTKAGTRDDIPDIELASDDINFEQIAEIEF
jgi:hypothetical protein